MRFRPQLALLLLAAAAVLWMLPRDRFPGGAVLHATAFDPYDTEILAPYAELRDARQAGDVERLWRIAAGEDYRAYRAALAIAQDYTVDPDLRLAAFERVLDLRIEDPLAREETRALHAEIGRIAEAAGKRDRALAAYREALPHVAGVAGLTRLEDDPYRRANAFLQARMYRSALDALGDLPAPSIEAPAHRALGEHPAALDAYERWLAEQPWNREAAWGLAWTHYALGDMDAAARAFAELDGPTAFYGQALVARRQGDTNRAVRLIRATGDPARLWLATGWLEAQERWGEAIDLYLEIASLDPSSSYADDAAYRAYVLGDRTGNPDVQRLALGLLPEDSFFALQLGTPVDVPTASTIEVVEPDTIALSRMLVAVHDAEAAVGELQFALRDAPTLAAGVALAEQLQILGDFRQSQRWAAGHVAAGMHDARLWKVAWPEAFAPIVRAEAAANEIEPELIWAIMRQESAFYPRARSRSNAQGLMQVIPSTWDWLAELQDVEPGDPFDPAENIRYGAYYLRYLLDYFDGNLQLAVASYNRGQGYIGRLFRGPEVDGRKDELYRQIDALETREYLQKVILNYEIYRALR